MAPRYPVSPEHGDLHGEDLAEVNAPKELPPGDPAPAGRVGLRRDYRARRYQWNPPATREDK